MVGWNKEFVTSLVRVEGSHYAENDEVAFASNFQCRIADEWEVVLGQISPVGRADYSSP